MTPRKEGSLGKVHKFLTAAERAALTPLIENTLVNPVIGNPTCQFKIAHSDHAAMAAYIEKYGMPDFDVTHVKRFRVAAYGKTEKEVRAPKPPKAPKVVQAPPDYFTLLDMVRAIQADTAYTKSMMQDFHTRYITDKQ